MNRNFTIDRLRGLSVLVVFCMHCTIFFGAPPAWLATTVGDVQKNEVTP